MEPRDDLPSIRFIEIYDVVLKRAILDLFNDIIRKNYYVTGYAPMPNGKVVIRLEKAIIPKDQTDEP